jgi:DNA polymerase III epsilon subunit-like protein
VIFHMIDTETTGLQPDPDAHVVEIAVVTYHLNNGVIAQFSSLVQPPVLTERGAEVMARCSKIEPAALVHAPSPGEVWGVVCSQLASYPARVSAWNLPFDRHMIRRTFLGLDDRPQILAQHDLPPEALGQKYGWPEDAPMLADPTPWGACAMRAFSRHYAHESHGRYGDIYAGSWAPKPWTLARAAERSQVAFQGQHHRALADATVAAELYARTLLGVPLPPEGE